MSRLTRLVDALSRPGATTSPRFEEATRLMRSGQLTAATASLQRALGEYEVRRRRFGGR